MGRENKWRRCQLAIPQLLCVTSLVFPPFSVFKVVYHEHLHFLFLLLYASHAVVSGTYPSVDRS